MKWDEFAALLSGIGAETALGRVVSIRSEDDKDVLKEFTPEMRKMRSEWRNRQAAQTSTQDRDDFVEAMRKAFIAMAGGEEKLRKEK